MNQQEEVAKILRKHFDFGTLMPTYEDLVIAKEILDKLDIRSLVEQLKIDERNKIVNYIRDNFDIYPLSKFEDTDWNNLK